MKLPTQVFSCEYCEIFQNSYFNRTPLLAAYVYEQCVYEQLLHFRDLFISTAFELVRKISLLMSSQFFKTLKVLKRRSKHLKLPRVTQL